MVPAQGLRFGIVNGPRRFAPLPHEAGGQKMSHSAESAAREAKISELKRLITTGKYETLEMLEDAVDAFLWSEHDRLQQKQDDHLRSLAAKHPK
jgi:hypothetical protein